MKKNQNNNSAYGNVISNTTRYGFTKTDLSLDITTILDSRFIESRNEMIKFTKHKWPTIRIMRTFSPEMVMSDFNLNIDTLMHNRE